MFDTLFGWRKASKCKKLIKRVQCRLKLLKNKRSAIAKQLREDIAHLLKNGHEHIAFNRLEQLYKDENIASVYELLDFYSEFIILHLSYIRRHKDLPNDINEAISSLIFASARCGDVPELGLLRKLFGERYGQRFATAALEIHPGNLVSRQVKDKLTQQEVPETMKNRMLDEIVRDYFFKPGPLALTYKPEFHAQPPPKVTHELIEVQGQNRDVDEVSISTNCSIVKKSPIVESFTHITPQYNYHKTNVLKKTRRGQCVYSSESSTHQYPDDKSVIYVDVEEFKSPTKQGLQCPDQDQRFFVFKSPLISKTNTQSYDKTLARKRMRRRRSVSMEKNTIKDAHCRSYYSNYRKKHRNGNKRIYSIDHKGRHRCSLDRPCYCYTNNYGKDEDFVEYNVCREEIEEMGTSPLILTPRRETMSMGSPSIVKKHWPPPPYTRAASKEIHRSISLPVAKVPKEVNGGRNNSVSPPHVHPKLPDYDEIAAKFRELKKVHQQRKQV